MSGTPLFPAPASSPSPAPGAGVSEPVESSAAPAAVPPQSRRPAAPAAVPAGGPAPAEAASDVVRWGAFSCAVVPVVLVVLGTSTPGALGTALCLAAVTGGCRVLLRRSERARVLAAAEARRQPHRGRHQRSGTGAHRGRAESNGGAHGA
ncbi:hypothetical protein [Streptomyces sp. NPDC060194]|uniref:hypothetical protein n=1 Tax=Streptomyces sp. NPDC060194 TaxID=3347069 RepID=UPI003657B4EB